MKIYTGTGDSGTTGLFGGERVTKNHPRIEAYGTVDELNASVGMALVSSDATGVLGEKSQLLRRIQSELFVVGADLATPLGSRAEVPRVDGTMISSLEHEIDSIEDGLEELRSFILPGGTAAASALHLARTICRRAERRVVELAEVEDINQRTTVYLNRLADLLFVLARFANSAAGSGDVTWTRQ